MYLIIFNCIFLIEFFIAKSNIKIDDELLKTMYCHKCQKNIYATKVQTVGRMYSFNKMFQI